MQIYPFWSELLAHGIARDPINTKNTEIERSLAGFKIYWHPSFTWFWFLMRRLNNLQHFLLHFNEQISLNFLCLAVMSVTIYNLFFPRNLIKAIWVTIQTKVFPNILVLCPGTLFYYEYYDKKKKKIKWYLNDFSIM